MDISRSSPRRNMASPIQDRLSTIMENNTDSQRPNPSRWSVTSKKSSPPRASAEPTPPPYARYAFQEDGFRLRGTDKLGHGKSRSSRRGGLGRLLLIILAVLLVLAIALGVGLGVGLTRKKKSPSTTSPPSNTDQAQPAAFPMGSFSFVTALYTVSTSCTSNSATWSCWPYTTYNTSATQSMATFNWVLSNTSSMYATNSTGPSTSADGIPANVSISTTDNPFGVSFTNHSVTYINSGSFHQYKFNFTLPKSVVPSTTITSDNSQSLCFYNQTSFSATLWLSAGENVPSVAINSSTTTGGYAAWPYAVLVEQISSGGSEVPDCYETTNGVVGKSIPVESTANTTNGLCECVYQNYQLT